MMEVADFVKEFSRMCDEYNTCRGCPMDRKCNPCTEAVYKDPQGVVEIVEKWSKEHPVLTNRDKFKDVFGDVGYPDLVVAKPGTTIYASTWWNKPYKAPKEGNE